jgi:hypothetical protein
MDIAGSQCRFRTTDLHDWRPILELDQNPSPSLPVLVWSCGVFGPNAGDGDDGAAIG